MRTTANISYSEVVNNIYPSTISLVHISTAGACENMSLSLDRTMGNPRIVQIHNSNHLTKLTIP